MVNAGLLRHGNEIFVLANSDPGRSGPCLRARVRNPKKSLFKYLTKGRAIASLFTLESYVIKQAIYIRIHARASI